VYTQVAIRALKEIHTATHPARLTRSTANPIDGEDGPPVTAADLMASLDDEAGEESGE
jgi:integrase/recombinase XerD